MQGNGAKDPLFLQVKEEPLSAYAPYLGEPPEPRLTRAAASSRASAPCSSSPTPSSAGPPSRAATTSSASSTTTRPRSQLSELKSAGLLEYAAVCGETLARGHARSGDPGVIAGYIGTSTRFDDAIAQFAADYADQTDRDWQALLRSRRDQPTAKSAAKSNAKPGTGSKAKGASDFSLGRRPS